MKEILGKTAGALAGASSSAWSSRRPAAPPQLVRRAVTCRLATCTSHCTRAPETRLAEQRHTDALRLERLPTSAQLIGPA